MLSQKTKNCRDLAGSKSQAGWAFIWWDFRIKFMQISGRALEGSRDMVSLMRKVTQNCKVLTFFAYDANFCFCLMCVCVVLVPRRKGMFPTGAGETQDMPRRNKSYTRKRKYSKNGFF